MRLLAVLSNLLLGIVALLGLMAIGPRVYEQAHFQFTDPRGGDSMWPMTFQFFLFLASFVVFFASFSVLFNHRARSVLRLTSGAAVICLFGSWFYGALLLQRDYASLFGASDYSYPPVSEMTIVADMIRFDGSAFMLIAIGMLSVATVTGRGPVSLVVHVVKKCTGKQQADEEDKRLCVAHNDRRTAEDT